MRYFLALIFFLFAYNCKAATVWVEDKVFYQAPVMKTKQELQKGLMFVKQLPQDQGMLFDFGEARKISMWMKNTYISLDMLFIDCALKIVDIHENTKPLSLELITAVAPVCYVLEINGGEVKSHDIQVGDHVKLIQ
ncbi:MAG: DUF192 domain-containing protein [Alphaproteobacteria bacterium]|nr:DUF192 domain-containing protein [Alphaproteobacteria bacterium]